MRPIRTASEAEMPLLDSPRHRLMTEFNLPLHLIPEPALQVLLLLSSPSDGITWPGQSCLAIPGIPSDLHRRLTKEVLRQQQQQQQQQRRATAVPAHQWLLLTISTLLGRNQGQNGRSQCNLYQFGPQAT
jgi:hypothetical protein